MPAACVFCAIARREAKAARVLESEAAHAFLDQKPLFFGHVLVVPPAHVATLGELAPADVGPFFVAVRRVARAVEAALGAEGTFVAMNNVVSQSVPHLHVHVVPRRRKDGLRGFFWPRTTYGGDEAAAVAASIRGVLDGLAAAGDLSAPQ
jgi:histidine triad (HIT) family protein